MALKLAPERRIHPDRCACVRWIMAGATLAILAHVVWIQGFARDFYMQYATVPPDRIHQVQGLRGSILDRASRTLALSVGTVDVSAAPRIFRNWATYELRKDDVEVERPYQQYACIREAAYQIADDLKLSRRDVLTRLCGRAEYKVLARRVEPGRVARLRQRGIGGLHYQTCEQRRYPRHKLAAGALGYCDGTQLPRTGVESAFRHVTEGQRLAVGELQVQGGLRERAGVLGQQVRPQPGNDLILTLDLTAQQVVERVLDRCVEVSRPDACSAVVMDAGTGGVVAIGSRPTYDPELVDEPLSVRGPVNLAARLNRPVTMAEEPGSLFKLVTIAAALDAGVITEDSVFSCGGTEPIGGRPLKCWGEWADRGHGALTPAGILAKSCNLGAAKVALRLGAPRLCDFLTKCGIGSYPRSGFPAEARGRFIAPDKMKVRDLANTGFGHSVQVSDLQMAAAVCAVMNGGVYHQPHVVAGYRNPAIGDVYRRPPDKGRRVCSEGTSKVMRRLARGVIESGTGRAARIANVAVGGKTATAQLYENGRALSGPRDFTMGFVLIAPVDREPDFVVLFTARRPQHGLHGSDVAAPRAREITQRLLNQASLFRGSESPATPQAKPGKNQKAT